MIKVLFVCLGNICRSPMAQFVLQQMVDKEGLTELFEIDSAGTHDHNEKDHAGIYYRTSTIQDYIYVEGKTATFTINTTRKNNCICLCSKYKGK